MPESSLHKAARDGNRHEIEALINEGLNVNETGAQGRTALHRALGGGFTECAQLLIEEGADPNIVDALKRTSLHWAAMGPAPHNVECCALVFAHGDGSGMLAKTTKSGSTPLHSAAGTNKPEVVRFLVGKGADQAAKDEDNMTAYDLAKANGYTEVMGFLDTTKGKADG
ncbi:ankyrin repeat protein, partial [Chrysochromulina tobinii]